MNLLAIETSSEACSVALSVAGKIIERYELAPRRHAELVLPMAESLLQEAGIARSSLNAIAVARGPGAFTGVRLGVAIAQGLALALDIPLIPVSSLQALAEPFMEKANGASILASMDARMAEMYIGQYQVQRNQSGAKFLHELVDESLCTARQLQLAQAASWIVVGSGWQSYHAELTARFGEQIIAHYPEALPNASAVARLAIVDFSAGLGIDPALAEPVYLRNKVAQTIAERLRQIDT